MQRIINDPNLVVEDMLKGFLKCHKDRLHADPKNPRTIVSNSFNEKPKVGIVTAKYASTGVEGLGFAIPVNDAVSIAGDLIRQGYVSGKAYMGVSIDQRYNSMYAQYWGMPLGAYVYSVESGSCADKAGVREKDIVTAIGDHEITGYTDLTSALHSFSAGDTTELKVYRGGEDITLTITFDEAKS